MAKPLCFTREDVTADGAVMLSLGSLLFALEPFLVTPSTEQNGYWVAVVLTTVALGFGVTHLARAMRSIRGRLRLMYGLAVETLVACWVAVWICQKAPLNLRILLLLCGLHGILWGLWLLKLALQVQAFAVRAAVVGLLAAITSASGITIAVEANLDRITALTLVACYTMYLGVVIISLELYLYRALGVPGLKCASG